MPLTTDALPVAERAEVVREAIWRSVARLEIEHDLPGEIRVTAIITDLGAVKLCEVSTTTVTTGRTLALTREDAPPRVFLQLQLAGAALIEQAGRQTVPLPGQLALIDSRATLLLVRCLLAAQAGGGPASREAARGVTADAMETRVLEYARQRLTDPGLNAHHIAAAHGISVRYLYKILARSGISLGSWIREQRLELCRVALRAPGMQQVTIAAIAHRAGFGDLTHFGRSFRSAYGMSPREYRAGIQAADTATGPPEDRQAQSVPTR